MSDVSRTDTGREIQLAPDELIITKTDTRGLITYANRTFMRIAGFPEHQLLGQPHNLIRHPDMPRGVYRLMWKTLQAGQEFFGIVKNFTASGDHYWVFANITPDYSASGNVVGYYSVRRQPSRNTINTIIPLYQQMRDIEQRSGKANAPDEAMNWLLSQMSAQQIPYEEFVLSLEKEAKA